MRTRQILREKADCKQSKIPDPGLKLIDRDGTFTGTIIILQTIKRKRRRNAYPWAPLATVTTVFD